MSLQNPHNVGSTATEAPETVWEFLVETEFNPDLSPTALDRIQSALWSRLHAIRRIGWPQGRCRDVEGATHNTNLTTG